MDRMLVVILVGGWAVRWHADLLFCGCFRVYFRTYFWDRLDN